MAAPVTEEKVVYLLDPVGASRASLALARSPTRMLRTLRLAARTTPSSCPISPPFLQKHGGLVFSLGQFMQYVGGELMASGAVQIWPGIAGGEALHR